LASSTKGEWGQKANKLVQCQNIVASEKAPPLFAHWTNEDEERMNGLAMETISIADTHYGQHAALKERELEAVVDSMSRDKRNELRQKLDECEMEDEATHMLATNKRKGHCLRMERHERFRYRLNVF
jgi:hypothetical protein